MVIKTHLPDDVRVVSVADIDLHCDSVTLMDRFVIGNHLNNIVT